MPRIEIDTSERIERHFAAVQLMSYMVFPDSCELRTACELTFRTQLADWYSGRFAELPAEAQNQILLGIESAPGEKLPGTLADRSAWMRNRLFSDFLASVGGATGAAIALTNSPSASALEWEWTRRWFGILYTGKLVSLIGSINAHHTSFGASLNKAIHVLEVTEGQDRSLNAGLKRFGFPAVYGSSLKEAWRRFKPVAHLCAAYMITETVYYEEELARDFMEYWLKPPAFHVDHVFCAFVLLAKSVEQFLTSFRPHSRREALIPGDEIYSLPDGIFEWETPVSPFRRLNEDEIAALRTYRAPKQIC